MDFEKHLPKQEEDRRQERKMEIPNGFKILKRETHKKNEKTDDSNGIQCNGNRIEWISVQSNSISLLHSSSTVKSPTIEGALAMNRKNSTAASQEESEKLTFPFVP